MQLVNTNNELLNADQNTISLEPQRHTSAEDAPPFNVPSISRGRTFYDTIASEAKATFSSQEPESSHRYQPRDFQRRTLNRMTATLMVTTTVFALLWIPSICVFIVPAQTMLQLSQTNGSLLTFLMFMIQLRRFNHFINPIIYGFICTCFRVAFRKLFCTRR